MLSAASEHCRGRFCLKACDNDTLMLRFPLQCRIQTGHLCLARTPLFMALRDGHVEMAQMLIAAHADVNFVTT